MGKSDKEIARKPQVSVRTVQGLIYRTLANLYPQSRTQLPALVWSGSIELLKYSPSIFAGRKSA
ncbi:MAG: hypothetical protein FJ314_04015 [SAR202 cluster bacterium]|nr:hypothetical protein [SAR202 cluster bacterium]